MARKKHSQLPPLSEYFVAAIECLKRRGGSTTIEEMEEDVAETLRLSDAARTIPHGDGRRTQFQYDLAWVRTYLKWGEALENSERGVWHLTSVGRRMSDQELRGLWKRIVDEQRQRRRERTQQELPPAKNRAPDVTSDTLEGNWKERLLDVLLAMEPSGFERLCQRLLRESGFTRVEITGRSGDGGIDGLGVLRLNLLSFRVLFQCKKWRSSVGAPVVRDFRGAMMGRADKGLLITTGNYTADARREATRDGAPPIDLIDGDALCDLLKAAKIGISINIIEEVRIDDAALKAI